MMSRSFVMPGPGLTSISTHNENITEKLVKKKLLKSEKLLISRKQYTKTPAMYIETWKKWRLNTQPLAK